MLSITQYEALYEVLGTTYGGDGESTFALPDLRGRTPVHPGEGAGLRKVTLGQKLGADKAAAVVGEEEGVTIQPYLALRFVIAIDGLHPSLGNQADSLPREIRLFAGKEAPNGWTFCNGQQLASGDGKTKYAVPDLRGRAAMHIGVGPASDEVAIGESRGGERAASATDPARTVLTQPGLGIHYMTKAAASADVSDAEEHADILRRISIARAQISVFLRRQREYDAEEERIAAELKLLALDPDTKNATGEPETLRARLTAIGEEKRKLGAKVEERQRAIRELGQKLPSSSHEPWIGEVRMIAGGTVPRGWASCDGQDLPIHANMSLFSLLGTIYGGDGRTTFRLPDLRGRVPVHVGKGFSLRQGATVAGNNAVAAGLPDEGVGTMPTVGVRYVLALMGLYPSRP